MTRVTLETIRQFAVTRSLFTPTTLKRALQKLAFVQADPIRAPARAQDLTLRHRVKDYRAGDLERRYAKLGIEEDIFVNYGFVTSSLHALMHPRTGPSIWSRAHAKRSQAVLEFVRTHGAVHPREVDEHFAHGSVTNYWGGSSNATTHLLDLMHYRGLLRIVRREGGIRIYSARESTFDLVDGISRHAQIDTLVDIVVNKYAPVPAASLSTLVSRLRYAVPQWRRDLKSALRRAKERLSHARIGDADWYWPANERLVSAPTPDVVRLLAPFDPVVWDRRRFELFWGWAYRFEAYTPASKRKLGYYALPMLWRDRVIGWGNISVKNARLRSSTFAAVAATADKSSDGAQAGIEADIGYVGSEPRDRAFRRELEAELDRMRVFLGLSSGGPL